MPHPISSGWRPSTARNGIGSPGSLSTVHSGRHGPNPPKRIVGSIFQRQPSASSRAPTDARYSSHSGDSRGFMRARRSASSCSVPGLRWLWAVRRRCSSQAWTSFDIIFVRLCSATSGTIEAYGTPSRLTNEAMRNGWASPSWIIIPPPLECPMTGTARRG